MNAKRKQIPKEVETAVLTKSRRRCCRCYFWEQDLRQQDGQIAHIDHDPSNPAEDNLAWLCFRHHNQYDSRQSQGKNFTPDELRHAREQLYAALASLPGDVAAPESRPTPLGAGLPTPSKPPTEGFPLPVLYRDANLPPRNPDFVGRENLKARVREFVSRPQAGGYLVLIGGMGRGKTAFLTELVHEEIEAGREPICHFIDYHPSTTGEGDTIVRSLLDQLRSKYPDLKTPEAWQTRPPDLPAQLEWTLRELSDRHSWGRDGVPPEVIYIDAADQAEADERRPLLPGFLRHLPAGVACVITTRSDRRWLRTRRGVTVWYLDQATEADMAAGPVEPYETDDELAELMREAPAEEPRAAVVLFAASLIDYVRSVAVTPDGQRAISASDDRTLKVWDLASGRSLASFVSDWHVTACALALDGRTFVASGARGRVHFLRLMEPKYAEKEVEGMTQHVFLSYCRENDTAVPEALLAIEEYRLLPPGSIYLIPVRLSESEIPPIELTPTRTLQDLQHQDIFPPDHRPAALARLLQSLAAAKRERT